MLRKIAASYVTRLFRKVLDNLENGTELKEWQSLFHPVTFQLLFMSFPLFPTNMRRAVTHRDSQIQWINASSRQVYSALGIRFIHYLPLTHFLK